MKIPRMQTQVVVEDLTDGTSTVVKVHLVTDEFCFHGSGSSRRMREDEPDEELGHLLALKRALDDIVASVDAKTKKIIRANDKIADAALNWRSKEEWEALQQKDLELAKAVHPAGKGRSVKSVKHETKVSKTKVIKK